MFFFFKQKTADDMRISDGSSDVCSSDLLGGVFAAGRPAHRPRLRGARAGRRGAGRRPLHRPRRLCAIAVAILSAVVPDRRRQDRKSAPQGKRVPARAALRGRRTTQKQPHSTSPPPPHTTPTPPTP